MSDYIIQSDININIKENMNIKKDKLDVREILKEGSFKAAKGFILGCSLQIVI
jgi:hypothetical protein